MYLTLDIGNTLSKFARFDVHGTLLDHGYQEGVVGFQDIKVIAVANVTDKQPALQAVQCPVVLMHHRLKLPFLMGYKTPETLGADRLAAVAGAAFLAPDSDFMVVDAGTCLKFEYLQNNTYQGGGISPGLTMRYRALSSFTNRLPEIQHQPFESKLGDSTETAILSGVQQGFLLEVEGRIQQYLAQNPSGKVFLTGGDAAYLAERLKTKIFAEPLLVHYGLYHTLRLNGY
jgi:type III pantothenate kinase